MNHHEERLAAREGRDEARSVTDTSSPVEIPQQRRTPDPLPGPPGDPMIRT